MSDTSRHGHRFDHDDQAARYDAHVLRESDPIRAGYTEALAWVAERARGAVRIVDLGAGTGNLTRLLPADARIEAVDLSEKMLQRARDKLAGRDVAFVREDLLAYGTRAGEPWDAVVSTYAIHHLEEPEKRRLLEALSGRLAPGGVIAVADLMFEDATGRASVLAAQPELREVVEDEFFWDLSEAVGWLSGWGFEIEMRRFSTLSWGLAARRG